MRDAVRRWVYKAAFLVKGRHARGDSSYYWSEMSSISLPKNVSFLDANIVIIGCALVSGFKDSLFIKSKDLAKAYS